MGSWCALLAAAAGAIRLLGCASIPPGRSAIDDVAVVGERALDEQEIANKLATRASPKFLGVFRGIVYDYTILDRMVLQRDLARVERYYRAQGYYEAHARAGRILTTDDDHVRVEILVEEGLPVRVRSVVLTGLEGLPEDVADAARDAIGERLELREPFREKELEQAEIAIRHALTDRGRAYAEVRRDAAVDLVRHTADVVFTITPGPACTFGDVTIEGLGSLPESPVRRALDLTPGDPYSTRALLEAHDHVLELGVFSSVEVEPRLDVRPAPRRVPIRVRVRPTRLHTVTLGAGLELDSLKADVHGLAGWKSSNFLGGLRRFEVQFRPGLVFVPTRIDNVVLPERYLFEGRLRMELRQPGLVEARTGLFLRPELSITPVLVRRESESTDPLLGYRELRASGGADRRVDRLYARLSHNVQVENPFAYEGRLDPALETIVLSYPELVVQVDLRDDRFDPHSGLFFGTTLQVAGGPFGGDADDVRVQPELRGYVPLSGDLTLAARATVGFLFPYGYGSHLDDASAAADGRVSDLQIVYFRGFFSGGATSNRGYPTREVGPHGLVPFLLDPRRGADDCLGYRAALDLGRCAVPIGGMSLWEASLELRADLAGPLSGALFCDASDVSPDELDVRLNHPHLSCGGGVRYKTPIGPVRLDVGYRIPGLQVPPGTDPRSVGAPGDVFGLPIALAFGVGEAF